MSTVLNTLADFGFANTLWVLSMVFVIHELEEWNIARVERRNYIDAPPTMTDRNARAWIAVACVIALVWCAAATISGSPIAAAYVFMPAIFIILTNSIQHVYWTIRFRHYSPGVISATALLIPASGFIIALALWQEYVSILYVAALSAVLVLVVINTARLGRKTPSVIRAVYGIGSRVSAVFGKRTSA